MTLHERMAGLYVTLVLGGKDIKTVPDKYKADVAAEIEKRKSDLKTL